MASNASNQNRQATEAHSLGISFLTFGVALPLIALFFETQTHWCAQRFFDPFPTDWHAAFFALIPISNFCIFANQQKAGARFFAPLIFASGTAFGIAILYSLMFLPLVPQAFVAVALGGFGLLGLSPLLALLPTWKAGEAICKSADAHGTFFRPKQLEHFGHAVVLCTVICVEMPSTFTRVEMHAALEPATQQQGLDLLRQYGNKEVLLRACYEHSGRATDIIGTIYDSTQPIKVADARNLYYRVTGVPYNNVPIPESARATIVRAGMMDARGFNVGVNDEFDYDPDVAGEAVSGVARGLTMKASTFAAALKAGDGAGSIDWTLTFHNDSKFEREVRARLRLPRNGFVCGASVVIDGKERQAKIQPRNAARAIYTSNAQARKDPLLVSVAGLDRVLVQCYPVRANGDVQVRLHIVAPLDFDKDGNGVLSMPLLEEKNFQYAAEMKHELSANSDGPGIWSNSVQPPAKTLPAQNVLHGWIAPSDLERNMTFVKVARGDATGVLGFQRWGELYSATVERGKPADPSHVAVTFIIDGSACMTEYMPEIGTALKALPADIAAKICFVGDREKWLPSADVKELSQQQCTGGQDDLRTVYDTLAAGFSTNDKVVWIHGSQPDPSCSLVPVVTNNYVTHRQPCLYELALGGGGAKECDDLVSFANVQRVAHVGTVEEDLSNLVDSWKRGEHKLLLRPATDSMPNLPAARMKDQPELQQISAFQSVMSFLQDAHNPYSLHQDGYSLAAKYNLVTPLSSLVAHDPQLEQEQEKRSASWAEANKTAIFDGLMREVSLKGKDVASSPMRQRAAIAIQSPAPSPAPSSPGGDAFASSGPAGDAFASQGTAGEGTQSYIDNGGRFNTGSQSQNAMSQLNALNAYAEETPLIDNGGRFNITQLNQNSPYQLNAPTFSKNEAYQYYNNLSNSKDDTDAYSSARLTASEDLWRLWLLLTVGLTTLCAVVRWRFSHADMGTVLRR